MVTIIINLKLYALISHDNTNFSTTKRLEHAFDRCSEVLLSQVGLSILVLLLFNKLQH